MELLNHMMNVWKLAYKVGEELGLSEEELIELSEAAMFHDIGKYRIPDIVNKPGKLTEDEFRIIKQHPKYSADALKGLKMNSRTIDGVLYHHERWDGNGYPNRLSGVEIPLYARIIAVVDSFDAMVSNRRYKNPISLMEAINEIYDKVRTQFDPEVVKAFLKVIHVNKYGNKVINF